MAGQEYLMLRVSKWYDSFRISKNRNWVGWVLLVAAFLVGLPTLPVNNFSDEGDHVITGLLLYRGYTLYGDLFTNHFPFAYYWAAAAVAVFGKSIMAVRWSVWFFQIASFGIAMKLSRFVLPLGLMSLMWAIIRHMYSGNMILYHAFSSASLVVVFAIVLAVLLGEVDADWRYCLAIGVFSTVAILSDPLCVYAVAIALVYLLITERKQGLMAALFTGGGLAVYAGWLLVSGTFQGFIDQAIVFNAQVFNNYKDANPVRIGALLEQAVKGLEILDPVWYNLNPLQPIPYNGSDRWLFTGVLYRLAIILASLLFLFQKKFRAASFLYLYACATLLNNTKGFRTAPFMLLAFLAASAMIAGAWWKEENRASTMTRLRKASGTVFGAVMGLMVFWLMIRVGVFTFIESRDTLSYDYYFANLEATGSAIKELACGQPDVALAHYPGAGYVLWFTDMKPVSRFIYMYPWEADVFLDEVISALDQEQFLAIVMIRSRAIWGYHVEDYLRTLYDYLDSTYVQVQDGVYLSPYLIQQCQDQTPTGTQ
jgi:hypothetical protein